MLQYNCSSHQLTCNLENIKVVFIPPNTTSVIQPLDQGIIKTLKTLSRSALGDIIIENIDKGEIMQLKLSRVLTY